MIARLTDSPTPLPFDFVVQNASNSLSMWHEANPSPIADDQTHAMLSITVGSTTNCRGRSSTQAITEAFNSRFRITVAVERYHR